MFKIIFTFLTLTRIAVRERPSRPLDNESLLALVRTRIGGLWKRLSTLEIMWLLIIKRLEETIGRFYVPADCTNRFVYL